MSHQDIVALALCEKCSVAIRKGIDPALLRWVSVRAAKNTAQMIRFVRKVRIVGVRKGMVVAGALARATVLGGGWGKKPVAGWCAPVKPG